MCFVCLLALSFVDGLSGQENITNGIRKGAKMARKPGDAIQERCR
jgi:hypothetical protein